MLLLTIAITGATAILVSWLICQKRLSSSSFRVVLFHAFSSFAFIWSLLLWGHPDTIGRSLSFLMMLLNFILFCVWYTRFNAFNRLIFENFTNRKNRKWAKFSSFLAALGLSAIFCFPSFWYFDAHYSKLRQTKGAYYQLRQLNLYIRFYYQEYSYFPNSLEELSKEWGSVVPKSISQSPYSYEMNSTTTQSIIHALPPQIEMKSYVSGVFASQKPHQEKQKSEKVKYEDLPNIICISRSSSGGRLAKPKLKSAKPSCGDDSLDFEPKIIDD